MGLTYALEFDPDLHPRDDSGKFTESGGGESPHASHPRVFNTPDEVVKYDSWGGGARWAWKNKDGELLTGEPVPYDQLPEELYHVTTNAPAVMSSGVLLGQRSDAGLGGGQADGVSFTTSKDDARVIQRELTRSVRIARGDDSIEAIRQYAAEDEKEAGLPPGTLSQSVAYAQEGWDSNKFILEKTFRDGHWRDEPPSKSEQERIRRSLVKDALNAYLTSRDSFARPYDQSRPDVPILKNPILFGNQDRLAQMDPKNIATLTVSKGNVPRKALVTTGSDKFLHEVRVYADVPSRHATAQRLRYRVKLALLLDDWNPDAHPRDEAGKFTDTDGGGDIGSLKQEPSRYFTIDDRTEMIPLSKVQTIRARPQRIANAEQYMQKAYAGTGKKRKPINLDPNDDGTYTVTDGNSTVAIARKHGWTSIPAHVAKKTTLTYRDRLALQLEWDEAQHPRDDQGKFAEAGDGGSQETGAERPTAVGEGRGSLSPAPSSRPDANQVAEREATGYNRERDLPPIRHGYVDVSQPRARDIADAYDALPDDDRNNPEVREAYEALSREVEAQWDYAIKAGMAFEPWTKDGQPYQTSKDMAEDVKQNRHMYFYTGGDPNPFMSQTDASGLSVNDKFRAIHDYFGHAAGGYGFGPRGEENAWMSHSQMLSWPARRALTTETRGQNSWVNFGRHNYDADGNHRGIHPKDRPFAKQKTALLPDDFVLMPGERRDLRLLFANEFDLAGYRNEEGQFISIADAVSGGEIVVDAVIQSAVMDTNTCDECADVDGEQMELGDDRQRELHPPYVKCLGGDRCRCVQLAMLSNGDIIDVDEIEEDTETE